MMEQNTNFIKRTKRTENFTVIDNTILTRKDLTFTAKGLLCYILSLPNDWIIHKTKLMKEFKLGRKALDKLFNELENAGYLQTVDMVREKGKFLGKNYFFYDIPIKSTIPTDVLQPPTVQPPAVKVQLQSTNTSYKELSLQNKHTQSEKNSDSESVFLDGKETAIDNNKLPKWLEKINGDIKSRFTIFQREVYRIAKRDEINTQIATQLINKYGSDDKLYEGYMRFETDRHFDLQLKLRSFKDMQDRFDVKFDKS